MNKEIKELAIRVIISLVFFIAAFVVPDIPYLKLGLFGVAYLIIGFDIIREAIENIFHHEFLDETFLMFIATVGAFATGEYPEAVMVMLLYQVGECFQDYAVDKSRDSISALMNIKPEYANIEQDGTLVEVDPHEIQINDVIIVKPGEKIPLDGVVVEGISSLDTSAITGESIPQDVMIDSYVYSGSINQTGMIKIKVAKSYEDSTVNKILELVENASDKKAKAETFITQFAKYYTPIVVVFAIILAFLPPLLIKEVSLLEYIHRACSFLVISCPCALVISIPLTFFAGLGVASKQGILVKGSNYLEILAKTKTVVFDKTGTLTKGTFEVSKISSPTIPDSELLRIAAYAENYSEHPIALSIKKAFRKYHRWKSCF